MHTSKFFSLITAPYICTYLVGRIFVARSRTSPHIVSLYINAAINRTIATRCRSTLWTKKSITNHNPELEFPVHSRKPNNFFFHCNNNNIAPIHQHQFPLSSPSPPLLLSSPPPLPLTLVLLPLNFSAFSRLTFSSLSLSSCIHGCCRSARPYRR